MRRIVVVGTTGSGKTTLAEEISRLTGIPHVELDSLYWGPNWTPCPGELFVQQVAARLAGESWVTDGNYSEARRIIWGNADTLVWLDYSLWVVYRQLIPRTLRRMLAREELWNGNRETFRDAFFSKDSLLLYAFQSKRKQRRTFPAALEEIQYRHLKVYKLKNRGETRRWLDGLRL